jgi:hypothetical protein
MRWCTIGTLAGLVRLATSVEATTPDRGRKITIDCPGADTGACRNGFVRERLIRVVHHPEPLNFHFVCAPLSHSVGTKFIRSSILRTT